MPKTKVFRCDICDVTSEVLLSEQDPPGWKTVMAVFCPKCWRNLLLRTRPVLAPVFKDLPEDLSEREKAAIIAEIVTDLRCPRNEWKVPSYNPPELGDES